MSSRDRIELLLIWNKRYVHVRAMCCVAANAAEA